MVILQGKMKNARTYPQRTHSLSLRGGAKRRRGNLLAYGNALGSRIYGIAASLISFAPRNDTATRLTFCNGLFPPNILKYEYITVILNLFQDLTRCRNKFGMTNDYGTKI
jgi:hypothetical protein